MCSICEALSNINDFLISNAIGKVLLSVISSFIFILILLKTMKPRIQISPHICHSEIDGKMYYIFKVVNRSIYDLYDLKFKLVKKTPYLANNGSKINNRLTDIDISMNHTDHFSRYKSEKGYGEHALLIRTAYNLINDIKDEKINVRLTVTGRHGLTNLTRIKSQDFTDTNQIHENKEFEFGKSLKVM
jgi:hypothetical protein